MIKNRTKQYPVIWQPVYRPYCTTFDNKNEDLVVRLEPERLDDDPGPCVHQETSETLARKKWRLVYSNKTSDTQQVRCDK